MYLICQEAAKLEPGAFYFDRKPTAKHIKMGFTHYAERDVENLVKKLDAMACEASVHGSLRNGMNFIRPIKSSGHRRKGGDDGVGVAGGKTRNGVGMDIGGDDSNKNSNKITDELFHPHSIGDEELDGDDSFTPRKWNGFNIR